MRRRKTSHQPAAQLGSDDPCVEVGRFGVDGDEMDRLRRDKHVLMVELVKLRQQQQNTRAYMQVMEERLRKTEMKQQQVMCFLAKAMRNPNFVHQLLQHKDGRKEIIGEAITKKRRQRMGQRSSSTTVGTNFVNIEPDDDDDVEMELQGQTAGRQKNKLELEINKDKNLDDEGFWDDLFNDDRY